MTIFNGRCDRYIGDEDSVLSSMNMAARIELHPLLPFDLSRRSWSPAASGPPGLSTAIFVAVDGPPRPIMAATDGPPLPQVVPPVYFNPIQLLE